MHQTRNMTTLMLALIICFYMNTCGATQLEMIDDIDTIINEVEELIYAEEAYREQITLNKLQTIKSDLIIAQNFVQDKKGITLDDPKLKKLSIYKSGSNLIKTLENKIRMQEPYLKIRDLVRNQEDFENEIDSSVKKPKRVRATPILHQIIWFFIFLLFASPLCYILRKRMKSEQRRRQMKIDAELQRQRQNDPRPINRQIDTALGNEINYTTVSTVKKKQQMMNKNTGGHFGSDASYHQKKSKQRRRDMTQITDKKIPSNLNIQGLTREASPTQYRTNGK